MARRTTKKSLPEVRTQSNVEVADFDQDDAERIRAEAAERDPMGGGILDSEFTPFDPSINGSDMIGDDTPLDQMPEVDAAAKKEAWKAKLRAAWNPEKRAALKAKLEQYYETHDHPMKGKNLSDETKERIRAALKGRTPLATCEVCGRPLSEHTSVENGVGPICATKKLGIKVDGLKLNQQEEEE